MVRRSVYLELLPFDSRFKNWADVDMWMRVCGLGGIAFVDQFLITLDDSPTPLRQFSFSKNALLQRMVITNIQRLLTGGEVHAALVRQRHTWRRKWLRWMFAGALRGDRQRMQEGIRYYRDNFLLS